MTGRAGVVLAGGRSTRFHDGDKALAELDGTPLIRRVGERLAGIVDELVVNCRATQVSGIRSALAGGPIEPRFAIDDVPDRGPVQGMAKSLRVANASLALVTACDMPSLDPTFLDWLFAQAAGETGAVPIFEDYPQPLCAVYAVGPAKGACHAALADGEQSLRKVLDRLDARLLPESDVVERTGPTTFDNVNTRGDLRALARRGTHDRP